MKRSTWVSLILLGGGVGLIAYLLFGELHPAITKLGENTAQTVEQISQGIEKRKTVAEKLLKQHKGLKEIPAVLLSLAALENEQAEVAQLKTLAQRLRVKLANSRNSDAGEVRDTIVALQSRMTSMNITVSDSTNALATKTQVGQSPGADAIRTIQSYAVWFDDLPGLTNKALTEAKSARLGTKLATYQTQSNELTTAYPTQLKLTGGLATRVQRMKRLDSQLSEQINALSASKNTQSSAQKSNINSASGQAAIISAGMDVASTRQAMVAAQLDWTKTIAAVPNDIDKVIIDMRSKSGVTAHKYKVITNGKSVDTAWTPVDKATYRKHRDHLGMTIYSKPAGVLPEDATVIASPPGYNYVGNRRYGRWEERNGQSFWVFYGRYSLMRDLFWGRGMYRPIYRSEYRGYRSNIRSRRAYYGAKKQYGTAKAIKSPKYSKSSYAKKRSSSGGYSGSKYSGSKRSGGYRSSRYRGSSFGGGGK
jgi:hypothetical protein